MRRRTTIVADEEDLETIRAEAARRGVSLAELMREVVADKASEIRRRRRPRFGIGSSHQGTAEASVRDEESPAASPPKG